MRPTMHPIPDTDQPLPDLESLCAFFEQTKMFNVAPIQVMISRDRYQCCHICFSDSDISDSFDGSSQRQKQRHFPAIFFSGNYYSLCCTKTTEQDAFGTATKLMQNGHSLVLTRIPKGYAIWTLEPDAIPSSSAALRSAKTSTSTSSSSVLIGACSSSPSDQFSLSESIAHQSFACEYISDYQLSDNPPPNQPPPNQPSPEQPEDSPIALPGKVLTTQDQFHLCYLYLPHTQEPYLAVYIGEHYYTFFRTANTIRQAAKLFKLLTHYHEQSIITKMPMGYGLWILAEM